MIDPISKIVIEVLKSTFSKKELGVIQKAVLKAQAKKKNISHLKRKLDNLIIAEQSNKLIFISLKTWDQLPSSVKTEFKNNVSLVILDKVFLSIDELYKNEYLLFKSLNPNTMIFLIARDQHFELAFSKSDIKSIKGIVYNRFRGKGDFNYSKIVARYCQTEGELNVFKLQGRR